MTRRGIRFSFHIIAELGDEVKPGLSSCPGALLRIEPLSFLMDVGFRIAGWAIDKLTDVLYTCN